MSSHARYVRCGRCEAVIEGEFYSDFDKQSPTYLFVWCVPCGVREEEKV